MPPTRNVCTILTDLKAQKFQISTKRLTMTVYVHGPAGARPSKVNDQEWMGILPGQVGHCSTFVPTFSSLSTPNKNFTA